MTPLTNPAVNELAVVQTTLDLFAEFLGRYFDGAKHDVGGHAQVQFPKPELLFQQSPITQPSDKINASPAQSTDTLAITMVWNDPSRKWIGWETEDGTRQQIVQSAVSFNFWVRAAGTNYRRQGKVTADLLHGLLGNAAEARLLGQKGILRVRPQEPRAVQDDGFSLALVVVRAQLRYPILSQV